MPALWPARDRRTRCGGDRPVTYREPVPMTEQGRQLIRAALETCEQKVLEHLLFHIGATNTFTEEDVDRTLRQELAVASHQVQTYWLGECNCDGHLN